MNQLPSYHARLEPIWREQCALQRELFGDVTTAADYRAKFLPEASNAVLSEDLRRLAVLTRDLRFLAAFDALRDHAPALQDGRGHWHNNVTFLKQASREVALRAWISERRSKARWSERRAAFEAAACFGIEAPSLESAAQVVRQILRLKNLDLNKRVSLLAATAERATPHLIDTSDLNRELEARGLERL